MNAKNNILILTVGICALVGSMLIGRTYGFEWAGGDGYREPVTATISDTTGNLQVVGFNTERVSRIGDTIKRGETLKTPANTRAFVEINDVQLFMDQRTDVVFERLFEGQIKLSVTRGRIVLYHHDTPNDVTVETNYLSTAVPKNGALTLVNYNFDETVNIVPFNDTSLETTHRSGKTHTYNTAVSVREIPMIVSETNFNPIGPTKTFYDWVHEKSPLPHDVKEGRGEHAVNSVREEI